VPSQASSLIGRITLYLVTCQKSIFFAVDADIGVPLMLEGSGPGI